MQQSKWWSQLTRVVNWLWMTLQNVSHWLKALYWWGKVEIWEPESGIKTLVLEVHINVKWREFQNEVNSPILAWLNLEEMIGDLSWTMISYICGWIRKSTELFSVAFGVEWHWMTEISLIVVQWEIVTISIERMGDWKNKPNSNHTGTVIWALHNAYYLFFSWLLVSSSSINN